ncbi:hypothetical protein [Duganella phyllosphaerae]|uniref:hypothetical protein n=1 Tax=Duganella phyllosphaerae TaxID=762836 RepID=UPI000873EA5D|nr:hypothetical protein [Duganella phyllosphaerae]
MGIKLQRFWKRNIIPLEYNGGGMLNINHKTRIILRATGSLQINSDGDEVLTGLTLSESNFMLAVGQQEPQERDAGDMFLTNQLRHRHLVARLQQLFHQHRTVRLGYKDDD